MFRAGKIIGNYEIVSPDNKDENDEYDYISYGDRSDCYKAVSTITGQNVFLKFYKSPSCTIPWYNEYQKYQARLMEKVNSSAELQTLTYKFIEFFEESNEHLAEVKNYIQVFEYVENGKDLRSYLNGGRLDDKARVTFAKLFAYSLSKFHEANIVHSDLKPENLFLFPADCAMGYNLRIVDFDGSIISDVPAPWVNADNKGYFLTNGYGSPEHFTGSRKPIFASDVFTCGLILYELLDKDGHPYSKYEDEEYKKAILNFSAPKPRLITSRGAEADKKIIETIHSLLNPDPDKRPTAKQLHQALMVWDKGREASDSKAAMLESFSTGKKSLRMRINTEVGARFVRQILPESESKYYSSLQFTLIKEDGVWYLVPCADATNPTVVDGVKIYSKIPLKHGSVIGLGSKTKDDVFAAKMKFIFVDSSESKDDVAPIFTHPKVSAIEPTKKECRFSADSFIK